MLIAMIVAYQFVSPAPPNSLTIATGGQQGAYYSFAQYYRELLAEDGISLEVISTQGSIENQRLLLNGIDAAFVQSGTRSIDDPENLSLLSLGSMYLEPLWVFHHEKLSITRLGDLKGLRIAAGTPGSGTLAVARVLMADNKLDDSNLTMLSLDSKKSVEALLEKRADVAILVGSIQSSAITRLLTSPGIKAMSFTRAEAYTRLHPFLSRTILPQGIIDLQKNLPTQDIHLLAASANLVVNPNTHPALVNLLLQAAEKVHAKGSIFEHPNEFPTPDFNEFPLSPQAHHFYKSGPPFLQRYLPFWAASLIDRMIVMLIPLLALIIPLSRITPPVYRWRVRRRIYRWYARLEDVDPLGDDHEIASLHEKLAELETIDNEVNKIEVPLSYADQLYHLRWHIEMLRQKIQNLIALNTTDLRETIDKSMPQ